MIHTKIKNTFKYFLITLTVVFVISCSGSVSGPTFDENITEIENGEVWDGYDQKRLDKCRVKTEGWNTYTTSDCSVIERDELYESYKGKFIVFEGFSFGYDDKLEVVEDGYLYKDVIFYLGNNSKSVKWSERFSFRTIKVKNLYIKNKKTVDFLFTEDQKMEDQNMNSNGIHNPRTTLTIKGLIKEVNPVCNSCDYDDEELKETVIEKGIIIDPSFE